MAGRSLADFANEHFHTVVSFDDKLAYSSKIYATKSMRFLKAYGQGKNYKLLDVGCGDGSFSARLKPLYDAYGIELNPVAYKKARAFGIKAVRHDLAKKFPFQDNYFDVVYSAEVIEHIYDTDFYLSEIYRVLKPGGIFLVTTPNIASLTDRFRLLLGKRPSPIEYRLGMDTNGHIRGYTFADLASQLRNHGFVVVKQTTSNFPCPVFWGIPKFVKVAAMKLGDFFPTLGGHIIIISRKK
ncbi:class I SAM-dependent methyltransferase [Candidatus Woesearchaeota archaeon]|nr:class I SAM-dependent methyltransferase [Candidatus Woesearchaeota archaeon]